MTARGSSLEGVEEGFGGLGLGEHFAVGLRLSLPLPSRIDARRLLLNDRHMEVPQEYITDEKGAIKSVVIDDMTFQRMEQLLLDEGLAAAMDEVDDDDTFDAGNFRALLGSE